MNITRRISLIAVAGVLAATGLTACGGGGSANASQTVEEACSQVTAELKAFGETMDPNSFDFSDADGMKKAMDSALQGLKKAEGNVGNAEVKAALGDVNSAMEGFAELLDDPAKMMDPANQSVVESITTSTAKMEELCPSLGE